MHPVGSRHPFQMRSHWNPRHHRRDRIHAAEIAIRL